MSKGMWTVLDQGLFAGANFVVNILLARWLTPEAYGAYSVAFTVFLLLGVVHQGLLTEPMLVFGTGRFRNRLPDYFGVLIRGHVWITGVGAAVMFAAAASVWAWGSSWPLVVGLLAMGVGQAGILLTWFARSTSYVTFDPRRSAAAGVLYAAILLGGTWGLHAMGWLGTEPSTDVAIAVGAMACAGTVSGVWLLWRAGAWPPAAAPPEVRREAVEVHKGYGPWAAAAGGVDWLVGYVPLLWLSVAGGLEAAGAYRALYNLALPALHVLQAMGTLLVPVLVSAVAAKRERSTVAALVGVGLAGGAVYIGALAWVGQDLLRLLYDGKFDPYGGDVVLLGFIPLTIAVLVVFLSALRALERPRALFGVRVAAFVSVIAPVAVLGGISTVRGALVALVALELVSVLALGGVTVVALRAAQTPTTETPPPRGAAA